MKYLRQLLKIGIAIGILILISLYCADLLIKKGSTDHIYKSSEEIPHNRVALLLGTSKFLNSGYLNLYYKYRIDAAEELFKAGKIEFILISGDNSKENYNEPSNMKEDLVIRGVPSDKIFLDYAGFRTLDSVIRCKEIFEQSSITIISQPFHNERAIYIAKNKNIDAIGFNAQDVSIRYGFKTQLREKFARVKMILDLTFGKKAKFLGEKVEIK